MPEAPPRVPRVLTPVTTTGRIGIFASTLVLTALRGGWYIKELIEQTMRVVLRCVLPILAVVGPFGMIIGVQGIAILELFGAHLTLPSMLAILMLREVSPLMVGIMLSLQSGSGFAGELGTMRVKEEIDATEMMAVDPVALQVLPRVLAIVLAAPVLYILASTAGIIGGWVVTLNGHLSTATFFGRMFDYLDGLDVTGGIIKVLFFGLIAGLLSCYQGYHASKGARGVATSTNRAVVATVLLIVVTNYFLTSALYGVTGG